LVTEDSKAAVVVHVRDQSYPTCFTCGQLWSAYAAPGGEDFNKAATRIATGT
jgi:hypothetical protein